MKKLLIASIRGIQGILPLTGREADRIHAFDQVLQWIVHAFSRDDLSILSPPPCPDTGKALMRFAVFVCAHCRIRRAEAQAPPEPASDGARHQVGFPIGKEPTISFVDSMTR